MTLPLSVIVPVGPHPHNTRWLADALGSIRLSGALPLEVIVINDMARLSWLSVKAMCPELPLIVHDNPWRLGVAASVNIGMAVSHFPLVVWLNSDDQLLPGALQAAYDAYLQHKDDEAFYSFTLRYADTNELQDLPVIGAYTKGLWRLTGGFPPEASVGACDHIFVSMLQAHAPHAGRIHKVAGGPHYLYRRHAETETATSLQHYMAAMHIVRDEFTRLWTPPTWTHDDEPADRAGHAP